MKKIMILGASIYQLPAIIKAKEMGLYTIAVSRAGDYPGFAVADKSYYIDAADGDKVLEIAKKENIDAITTICTDFPMRTVAKVASNLGLPGISEKAAFNATDKIAMRFCLQQNNVPIPKFRVANNLDEFLNSIKDFSNKCVIKAPDNSGSKGIKMLDDSSDIQKAIEAYNYCFKFSKSGMILIEEFMDGPEVCVETLNYKGVCYPIQVTDQLKKMPPYFTDAGYSQPTLLSNETRKKIEEVAIAANIALENFNGSSCTEIIVTKEGPKVVEVGPRLAGDCMTTHLVPLSTGVDMVENVINIALGNEINISKTLNKGSCIRYYLKPVIGTIKDIQGVEEAKSLKGVQDVVLLKHPGDEAVELRSSADRIAYVISQADNAEDAISLCENALNKIEVIV